MSDRAIVTYAAAGHEELLDISMPGFKEFAQRHGYEVIVGDKETELPPAWNKIPILAKLIPYYREVVWFDADLVVVDTSDDFQPMGSDPTKGYFTQDKLHALVRHFEECSEVPNSGVWRLRLKCGDLSAMDLLRGILDLEVFTNHGWWEQAALLTLMGYTVPPDGSDFTKTKCRNVVKTKWYNSCQFMRLCWNSHPNYRAERPKIVHCSYPSMQQRIEVMRALVADPAFNYPRYDSQCDHCKKPVKEEVEK